MGTGRQTASGTLAAQTALPLRLGRSDVVEYGGELVCEHGGGDLVAGGGEVEIILEVLWAAVDGGFGVGHRHDVLPGDLEDDLADGLHRAAETGR